MKKLSAFILLLSLSAQAGLPPTTSKGAADSSGITTFNYLFPAHSVSHSGTSATILPPTPAAPATNFIGQTSSWAPTNTTDRDLEVSVGNWAAFADAAALIPVDLTGGSPNTTCTRVTSSPNPLDGAGSLLITKGAANRQGEGCSVPFNVQPAYQGGQATITFPLNIVSGSIVQGDVKVFVYNVTKSLLITPDQNDVLPGVGVTATFPLTARDAIPVNHQYRLGIYFASASTTAVTIEADNFAVSPGQAAYGMAGSNTSSNLSWTYDNLGTVSGNTVLCARAGDRLNCNGNVTAGTVVASTFAIDLPSVYALDSSKLTSQQQVGGLQTIAGSLPTTSTGPYALFYDGSSTSKIFMAITGSAGTFTKATGSNIGTGVASTFWFSVPIAGLDAGVQISPSKTFFISSYLANGTRVTSAPTALGQYRARYKSSANSNTFTDVAPTTAPTTSDGMRLHGINYTSAQTSGLISLYDIYIGQGKSWAPEVYSSAARTGLVSPGFTYFSSTRFSQTRFSYDPATGVLTVDAGYDPSGASTTRGIGVNSSTQADVADGYFDIKVSDNAQMVGMQMPRCEVIFDTPSGHGATSTKIRKFTVKHTPVAGVTENCFSTVTFNDSNLGTEITIGEDGVYAIDYNGDFKGAAGASFGITVDSNQLTTNIFSITTANTFLGGVTSATGQESGVSRTKFLSAGQVIRPHTAGSVDATTTGCIFSVTKVSN